MRSSAYLDTNYILRFLLNDNETQSPIALRLFKAVEEGIVRVETSMTVVFEVVYVMTSVYRFERATTAKLVIDLLGIDGIVMDGKANVLRALDRWTDTRSLSFADCVHLELTSQTQQKRILSFDRAISNRIPDVVRVETLALPD